VWYYSCSMWKVEIEKADNGFILRQILGGTLADSPPEVRVVADEAQHPETLKILLYEVLNLLGEYQSKHHRRVVIDIEDPYAVTQET